MFQPHRFKGENMKIVEGYQKKVEEVFRLKKLIEAHGSEAEIGLEDIESSKIDETLKTLQEWIGENIEHDEPDDEIDGKAS